MSERRFVIREWNVDAPIRGWTVTESELRNRWNAAHVAMGQSDHPWETALGILLHGEKEPPTDEREAWVQRCPLVVSYPLPNESWAQYHERVKQWFREEPKC